MFRETLLASIAQSLIVIVAAIIATISSFAASAAEFYAGKIVTIIVGSEPGGGYDTYARLAARHLGDHIPGHPTVIVQNMPGAGSITAVNYTYNVAPQDGTIICLFQKAAPFAQILGQAGPRFEATKLNWLGSLNNEVGVLAVMSRTGVKTIDDLRNREIIFGVDGPNDTEIFPSMLNNMLGTKMKLVAGYASTTQIMLAMERGEIDGVSDSWTSMKAAHADWITDRKVTLLAQISSSPHPDLPNVPLIGDLASGSNLRAEFKQEEARIIWQIMLTQKVMGRPFALGPRVPRDRLAVLRKAFDDMLQDPAFSADAQKAKIEIVPVSGAEVQGMIERVAAAPKVTLEKAFEISRPKR